MLFRQRPQLGFPRRVVSYYLLFCTVAVTWLSLGLVYTVHTVELAQTESSCLARLGKAAAAIEMAYLQQRENNLSAVLEKIRTDGRFDRCAIVDLANQYIAHTDKQWIGKKAVAQSGQEMRWDRVQATRYLNPKGLARIEFRVPLIARKEPMGALWATVAAPDFWATSMAAIRVAPVAILVPLGLVGVGALMLRRLVQPLGEIQRQLATIGRQPPAAAVEISRLPAREATFYGWNRLVDRLEMLKRKEQEQGICQRIAAALKSHKQNESQQILESLSEGVAITDAEGRITFANRAIAYLLGEEASDGVPANCDMDHYLAKHVDNVKELDIFQQQNLQRPARTELSRTLEGRQRILRVARYPLPGAGKRHVWSMRDITQQKQAEEMRSQFIDSATHELRTPLANIKAYAETLSLMGDVDIEQQKEFCNTINSEATRLARFVDDLLSVSSMEVGSLSIRRQKVDLARLFAEVAEKVEPMMRQKAQTFEVHLPEKMGEANLDKDKIAALLVNLLGNASKYTPESGRVSLQVKIMASLLHLVVEDSGVGIDAEELPHVFDKFFRSKDPRVQNETGTGLGLSLAREIARLHGGDLAVTSQLDKGTTFTATIPLQQATQ